MKNRPFSGKREPAWFTSPPRDEKYHIAYHNQMQILAGFVSGIDLANRPYRPLTASAEEAELYVMGTSTNAFGWGQSYEKDDISGTVFRIDGLGPGIHRFMDRSLERKEGKNNRGKIT